MYPLATVQYLIDDGFLVASANTLPFGWCPTHTRPASDLINAFHKMEEVWSCVPHECFTHNEHDEDAIADAVQVAEDRATHAKLMRLAVIGMWNAQERWRVSPFRTENEQDVHGPVRLKKYSEKGTL